MLLRIPTGAIGLGLVGFCFVGDGSLAVLISASPSADIDIRTGSRGRGGDGVFSPSALRMASPSYDNDNRNEGGPRASLSKSSRDRFRLWIVGGGVVSRISLLASRGSFEACGVSFGGSLMGCSGASSVAFSCRGTVDLKELLSGVNGDSAVTCCIGDSWLTSLVEFAVWLTFSAGLEESQEHAGSSCWSGFDFLRSFWRRFWNHI